MKKTSNVIIKALIIAIILIAVLFLAPRIYYAFFYVDDSLSSEDNDVKLLTETYPTTFYFIGCVAPPSAMSSSVSSNSACV